MGFRKILIANRGEIACRIAKTAHRLGYRTVAVFSSADAGALHVRLADEAVPIGPAPAAASYLDIGSIIDAARRTGAEAVHPGYGFLSERADFAHALADAGLVFIGPPAAAIAAMGDKAAAKRRMIEAGVPCVPGYFGTDAGDDHLGEEAVRLGFPLLVKAVAGGGGRGMRRVDGAADLAGALASARREAESAFGDGTLMLERLIEDGRHVEVQLFGDSHGAFVHLGERDCTAQRRRQKVIEESPSPIVTPALREALTRDAIAAARAVGYRGAGTVEFIVDRALNHYFLEMNTRLQVEHPVTECVTGLDLVEWQIRIADGEPLPLRQEEITFSGHAIEARLCAEDPYDGWKPQTGKILAWRPECAGLRVDHGIHAGDEVTPYYDSMVAKLIAHGTDRADARRRLARALEEAPLFGPATNAAFLRDLVCHPRFAAGTMTTSSLDSWQESGDPLLERPQPGEDAWRIAAALRAGSRAGRPDSIATCDLTLTCGESTRSFRVPADDVAILSRGDGEVLVAIEGIRRRYRFAETPDAIHLATDGVVHVFREPSPWPQARKEADPSRARAPVAGTIARILVQANDRVAAGQPLVSVEAMKMELVLTAATAGRVRAVHAEPGRAVASGDVLVDLEIDP